MRETGIDRVAFYGTLMRRFGVQKRLGVEDGLEYLGPCEIEGELRDLGRFPGLLPPQGADGLAHGELYRILRPEALTILDEYEGHDPANEAGSEFTRRAAVLRRPMVTAWVYFISERLAGDAPVVASGVWNPGAG